MKKTHRVTVRVEASEYHRLCDAAAKADASVSELVRQALMRAMVPTTGSLQMIGGLGSKLDFELPTPEETDEMAIGLRGWDDP